MVATYITKTKHTNSSQPLRLSSELWVVLFALYCTWIFLLMGGFTCMILCRFVPGSIGVSIKMNLLLFAPGLLLLLMVTQGTLGTVLHLTICAAPQVSTCFGWVLSMFSVTLQKCTACFLSVGIVISLSCRPCFPQSTSCLRVVSPKGAVFFKTHLRVYYTHISQSDTEILIQCIKMTHIFFFFVGGGGCFF